MLAYIEDIFQVVVQWGILLMECVGVIILLYTTFKSIIGCLTKDPHVRLRTVIVREWSELAILGAIIALRGALTLLIHWEIKTEEANLN